VNTLIYPPFLCTFSIPQTTFSKKCKKKYPKEWDIFVVDLSGFPARLWRGTADP
jgi:hypothetical protein